jgi:hypothetical protein
MHKARPHFAIAFALAAATLLLQAGTTTAVHAASAPSDPTAGLPQPVTYVTSYGAVGDGHTDSTAAIAMALAAGGSAGGSVYFPAGHYMVSAGFGSAVQVKKGQPLTVAGAGAGLVTLTETNPSGALMSVKVDHTIVQDLTLDSQTHNARQALGIGGNYVTIQRCTILGGTQFFAIYATGGGTPSAPQYHTGNQMLNLTINDQFNNDGFSWSMQQNSLIENIDHTGSRLALYVDSHVVVQNYTYHPGSQTATSGFWISAPSDNIIISNFTTYGKGGVMSANGGRLNTNITITNETFLGTGGALRVDGANGLTISGCNFGSTNTLLFSASIAMSNIVVQNCPSLPLVHFMGKVGIQAAFNNNTYPASSPLSGPHSSFYSWSSAPVTGSVTGGSWSNQAGGLLGGKNLTVTVTNLAGYN